MGRIEKPHHWFLDGTIPDPFSGVTNKVMTRLIAARLPVPYPLIRPLTLVLDVAQDDEKGMAAREFVEYALHQAGQGQAILAGFFPFDPPTLRGEMAKLEPAPVDTEQ